MKNFEFSKTQSFCILKLRDPIIGSVILGGRTEYNLKMKCLIGAIKNLNDLIEELEEEFIKMENN